MDEKKAKENEDGDLPENDFSGPPPVGIDVYQPKERFIFKYFDGEKMVVADPLVLYRRIMARINEIDIDMKASSTPGFAKADDAYDSLVVNLRKIFKVKALEEGGLTPTELEDLFAQFSDYCEYHKKKWNPTQTLPTETSASTASSSAANPATPNILVTTSTPNEPPTEKPTSSPSVPESPTERSTQEWRIGET